MDRMAKADGFLGCLEGGDYEGLAAVLDPDVEMRALLPDGPDEWHGRKEVTGRFRRWFGTGKQARLLHAEARVIEDRVEISYGFRILDALQGSNPGWRTIEQRAFCEVGELITRIDLVCTGFRPDGDPADKRRRFDAGDLGCGDGLPKEFRKWVRSIEVGEVMEIVTGDPSAKEDLPSLARLMGNTVQTVEALEDGRLLIVVERGK